MTRTRCSVGTLLAATRRARTVAVGMLVLTATLLGLFTSGPGASARTNRSAPPARYLTRAVVADSATGTAGSGRDAAAAGGRYASFGSVPSGHTRVQRISTVADADVLATTSFAVSIPRRGDWGVYTGLQLRMQRNGSGYTVTVHILPGGKAALLISRKDKNGRTTRLRSTVTLPTMRSGATYDLQAVIVGTRIWARVWRSGERGSSWTVATDRSSAAVQGSGSLGVILAAVGHWTSASARFGATRAWIPARRIKVKPTPPVKTPPSTTPPSTTPPSTTPPSTTPPSTTPPSTTPPSTTPPSTTPPSTTPPSTTPPSTGSSPQHATQVMASAGSLPVGKASYAVPSGAIFVATTGSDSGTGSISSPFASVNRAIRAASAGSTIVLRGGTYHQTVYATSAVHATIQSYPGEAVWFDGSSAVSGWTKVGSDWVHSGWTTQFDHSASFSRGSNAGGFVNSAHPMAAWPDQVFVDGNPLQQVAANPSAGEFAVDYNAKQIVVGSDPTGHAVRASDLQQAFVVGGTLSLRGFGVRNYATSLPLIGTIYFGETAGPSTFENLVLMHNATTALATNNKADTINHVTTFENGMTGMGVGHADGTVVENCRFDSDNIENFNDGPASAGIKVGRTDGIVIKDNYAVDGHNHAGIWTDENVVHFAITGNVIQDNGTSYGIENELSGMGIVANNTVSGSYYGYTAFDSGHIAVYNNDLDNNRVWDIGLSQDNRWQPGKGTAGPNCQPSASNPWLVENVVVANNNFGRSNGAFQFYAFDKQTYRSADSMNLQVQGNQFAPRDTSAKPMTIGWGMGDIRTVHAYATPAAFNAGENKSWPNVVAPSGSSFAAAGSNSVAMGLPSDVAAAIGQPAGTKHIGTF